MIGAIEKILVPILREKKFKGAFPYFYREKNGHTDQLSFQFNKDGGSFAVNISYEDKEKNIIPPYPGKDAPSEKLKAFYSAYYGKESIRLGSKRIVHFLQHHKLLGILFWLLSLLLIPLLVPAYILSPSFRLRIGLEDHWFEYRERFFARGNRFDNAAKEVIPYLENQAEEWWRSKYIS